MIKILSENGQEKYGICHFTIDTPNDLSNLPTEPEMGSTCFVVSTSETYMINSNHEWKKIQASGGGGDDPVIPEIGFVPTEWNENGYITKGTWYGITIPANACFNMSYLSNLTFNDNVIYIGSQAFHSCSELILTELPSNLTTIETKAFYNDAKINITEIPSLIETIKSQAFSGCTSLTSLTFKGTPTNITNTVFSNCSNLTTINVPWSEGDVAYAPWGATNATINYNYISE